MLGIENLTIFDCLYEEYKIIKPIRLIELFGGVGSQAMALRNIGANFEHYRLVEWDKYPVASYNAIHKTNFEPTDITKIHANDLGIIDTNKYEYIMTYSFPCQDLSLAGKQKGMSKGSGTRSGLLWEVERLLNECDELPQILLMENVPEVIGQKNIKDFQNWQYFLESKGYKNYVQVLNAKDYGIPQNRRRCFMVSILGDYNYIFPKKQKLKLKLKDMLEDEVDEKYFLSEKMISFFKENSKKNEVVGNGFRFKPVNEKDAQIAKTITTRSGGRMDDNFIQTSGKIEEWHQRGVVYKSSGIAPSICATDYKTPKLVQVGELDIKGNDSIKRIYSSDGISPTLTSMQGGNRQPKIVVPEATKKGYAEAHEGDSINLEQPNSKTRRGRGGKEIAQTLLTSCQQGVVIKVGNYSPSGHNAATVVDSDGIAPTVMENHGTVTGVVVKDKDKTICLNSKVNGKQPSVQDRVYSVEGCSTAITTSFMPSIAIPKKPLKNVEIPQIVKVRKYPVQTDRLKRVLRSHKNISISNIANILNKPKTLVEHWFRNDESFAIPDADIWFELKELLGIETDEFDKSITTFEEKEGKFEKANRCYHEDGIAPTLTATTSNEKILTSDQAETTDCLRIRKLTPKECWRLMGFKDEDFDAANKVNSNAQLYKQAGNSIVVNVLEAIFKQLI